MEDNSSSNKLLLWGGFFVVLCVIVGWLVVSFHLRRQRFEASFEAIVNEICSVGELRKAPVVNHSNSILWYARNEEKGLGIHRMDLKTSACCEVRQLTVTDTGNDYFKLFGWSPDDQYAVLYYEQESWDAPPLLAVCHGEDGSLYETQKVNWAVEKVSWRDTNSFFFLDASGALHLYTLKTADSSKQSRDKKVTRLGNLGTNEVISAMTVMSNKTLAFVRQNGTSENIWTFDVEKRITKQLSHFTNVVFEWLNYSPGNKQFIFCWTEPGAHRRHLFQCDPGETNNSLKQLTFDEEHTFNGQWIQRGAGYAYVGNPGNISYLAVRPKDASGSTNLFKKGYVRNYTVSPTGDKIYALASIGLEPQGIWEYDIVQKTLRCIVPGTNAPFTASEISAPVIGFADSKDGVKIPYYMLPPRNFQLDKKYPAVIDGPCESRWRSHSQLLANVGVYYVAVNRRGLASSDDLSGAAEDILQVYQKLLDNPSIDSKRIFIMGISLAAGAASQLVEKHPELWRGAILNSPTKLPELLKDKKYPPILICAGDQDYAVDQVRSFEKGNRRDHSIKTVYYPNAGHMLRNVEYTRDRERRLAEFVLNN